MIRPVILPIVLAVATIEAWLELAVTLALLTTVVIRPVVAVIAVAEPVTGLLAVPLAISLAVAAERTVAAWLAITAVGVTVIIAIPLIAAGLAILAVVLMPVLTIGLALLLRWAIVVWLLTGDRLLRAHRTCGARLRATAEIVLAAVTIFVFTHLAGQLKTVGPGHAPLGQGLGLAGGLELLAVGHDYAAVVLGVLEIILSQNAIAGRLRVTCERQVFLRNMGGGAANFHIGSVRLEATRQRVLPLAERSVGAAAVVIAVAVVVATATTAVLLMLTWPHWRSSSCSLKYRLCER